MFVTLVLAGISAKSDIQPEALYLGTVLIDLEIVMQVSKMMGVV